MSSPSGEPVTLVLVVLLDGARLATLRVQISLDDAAQTETVAKAVPLDAVLSLVEPGRPTQSHAAPHEPSAAIGDDHG